MCALHIGVIGPGDGATARQVRLAEHVGELIALSGSTLICGGLGGVMEGACRGAVRAGGLTVGMLPGADDVGNDYLTVALTTGLGELRNGVLVNSCDSVICIGGSWGTLSEMALTLKASKACIGIDVWTVVGMDREIGGDIHVVGAAEEAVVLAVEAARRRRMR